MQAARYRFFALALFACALVAPTTAAANETICVGSSGGVGNASLLLSALSLYGDASDETIYLHLEQGVYSIPGSQNLIPGGNASLHLVGGFVPGSACTQRSIDPALTTIKGSGGNFLVLGQKDGELLIDSITFANWGDGVEVRVFGDANATLRNIAGTGNNASTEVAGLLLDLYKGGNARLRVENCLISGNGAGAGLGILSDSSNATTIIDNCTIVDNSHEGLLLGDVTSVFKGALFGYSNIIRGNPDGDVDAAAAAVKPTFAWSDIGSFNGSVTTSNNINSDPLFAGVINPPRARYELLDTSPAINKGAAASTVVAQTGDSSFAYADTDIRGRKRKIGSRVDIGAYESTIDDTSSQTVDTTSDAAIGNTLRVAIAAANGNANPTTIKFNIAGACPRIISLGSLLPAITSDVTIDAYTEPGAAPNTQVPGYDGKLCIVLAGNGLDYGLQTSGSGRLTVRGIEFEDFNLAAVRLASGSGHVVTGNGFASFPGAVNNDGVRIEGTATYSQIGSYAFGDRNVFNGSADAAIRIGSNGTGHHVIQGNYFGYYPDGTVWDGTQNKYGIYLLDSASNEISYNFIGGSLFNAIHLTGSGTGANRIIENSIGLAPADNANAGGGYGTCNPLCFGGFPAIDVVASAHDNFVGAIGAGGGNNFIVNNDGPGVSVESTAGVGNRVYGNNVIHDNNGYLPIDLGVPGPTLNDVGDGDGGGNKLQNYPTLSQALRIEADVIRVSGSLVAQTGVAAFGYRIDVFWTDSCLYSGGGTDTPRGDMKRYVGFFNIYADGSSPNVPYSAIDVIANPSIPKPTQATPGYLFAVATDAYGNSSEPGPCRAFVDDYIFSDGYD